LFAIELQRSDSATSSSIAISRFRRNERMRAVAIAIAAILLSTRLVQAQEIRREDYEAVLAPVLVQGTVAGGVRSTWITEAFVRNDAPVAVGFGVGKPECRIGCSEGPITKIPPHATMELTGESPLVSNVVFYVEKNHADELDFSLHVRDTSRTAFTWGTELPLVRESDFRDGRVVLLNVPRDPRYRLTLRIYSLTQQSQSVHVTVSPLLDNDVAYSSDVLLKPWLGEPDDFPRFAAYAQVDHFQALLPITAASPLRVEVEGASSAPIWAFVSITNNETQQVTTVTPQ
jgi:hypothetical protein